MAFARGRIGDEAPCLKLIIDEGASPAMRTDARQILDLRAAFLADHPSLLSEKILAGTTIQPIYNYCVVSRLEYRNILP